MDKDARAAATPGAPPTIVEPLWVHPLHSLHPGEGTPQGAPVIVQTILLQLIFQLDTDIPNHITKMVHKKCSWLMRGKTTTCPRGAVGEYCAQYNYQTKHGAQPFHPCRACGAGYRMEHRLCKACGGVALTHRLHRLEEQTKKPSKTYLMS